MKTISTKTSLNYNPILDVDSYKLSHWPQYPEGTDYMMSYLETRGGEFDECTLFGLQYVLHEYLSKPVTIQHVVEAAEFAGAHGEPFNYDGWMYIVEKCNGFMPVRIRAIPEGMVVPVKNAVLTIECFDKNCFWVVSWLETMLSRLWYPSTIATTSRESKKILKHYHDLSSETTDTSFSLHDFGARGCASLEQSRLGGAAHLLSFMGSDTVEGIRFVNHYYDCDMAGFSIPACYDDSTEILTEKGFKLFSGLGNEDRVAAYNADGSIDFVTPSHKHEGEYQGNMVQFTANHIGKVDLLVTPNHRMVRRSQATGEIEIQEAADATFSHRNDWLQAGKKKTTGIVFSALDRLKIAFQADGAFPSRKHAYPGTRSDGLQAIRFGLKKDRKKQRLEEILNELEVKYTRTNYTEGTKEGYSHYWIRLPYTLFKQFNEWVDLSKVDAAWCKEFISELQFWDGTVKGNSICYSTSVYENVSVVQAISTLAGMRSSISVYDDPRGDRKTNYTVICSEHDSREGKGIEKSLVPYKGKVYCVTVPSGMVVVRRNGIVSISGNSEHSTVSSWGRDKEIDFYKHYMKTFLTDRQLPPGIPKLAACVSDTYHVFEAVKFWCSPEMREVLKASGGTLVIRPDSGEPVETLEKIFDLLEECLGNEVTINNKGYKVLPPYLRVIQGDGIDRPMMKAILHNLVVKMAWSATNIAFGSGGGLLQKVNRDTQKWAFKCCAICVNGELRHVFKDPITDPGKKSKSGLLDLAHAGNPGENCGYETVNLTEPGAYHADSVLNTVYDCGKILYHTTLAECRERMKL